MNAREGEDEEEDEEEGVVRSSSVECGIELRGKHELSLKLGLGSECRKALILCVMREMGCSVLQYPDEVENMRRNDA